MFIVTYTWASGLVLSTGVN